MATPFQACRIVSSWFCGAVPIISRGSSRGTESKQKGIMRSPVVHQNSSPRQAAADPPELSSGSCHGRCVTRPGGSPRHSAPVQRATGPRSCPGFGISRLLLLRSSIEPKFWAVKSPTQHNLRGICILLRTRSNRLSYRHMYPLSRATLCTAGSWLTSCGLLAVAVLRPTPTSNCYAQPLMSLRLSHRCSGALAG